MTPRDRQSEPREEWVPADDRVIATAVRRSLIVLAVVLLLAAAGVWWYTRPAPKVEVAEAPAAAPARLSKAESPAPPELRFTDVTRQAGIDFVHDNGAYGLKLLPETMGSGAAFADFDDDGDADLLLVNGDLWPWHDYPAERARPTQRLYLNDGTGSFTDATGGSGLDASFYGTAPAVGDFDGDGRDDVFIAAVGGNRLFRNLGDGRFQEVTERAGVSGDSEDWSSCAAFVDIDADGDLDLYVCNYVQWSRTIDLEVDYRLTGIGRAYGPPNNYAGSHSCLYRNDGDGTFTDISERAGIEITRPDTGLPEGKALAVRPSYVNDDGMIDLIVANDTVRNFVFINQGGTFEERGVETGLAFDPSGHATGAMGIDIARVGVGGPRVVAIGNFSGEMTSFYLSQGRTALFADQAATSGVGPPSRLALSFGVFFFDADLDGRPDLFQTNGHLEEQINVVRPSQHYAQPAQLFWNCGSECPRRFATAGSGDLDEPLVGRAAAYADIEGDGDLDILITQVARRPVLLRNDQETGHHWLRVHLAQDGPNPRAIGALVRAQTGSGQHEQMIMPTRSYQAQVQPVAHFGLGADAGPMDLEVTWPDRDTTVHAVDAVNRTLVIDRPSEP